MADFDTFRTTPGAIWDLAVEIERLWLILRTQRNIEGVQDRGGIVAALRGARLTPEDIVDRLTAISIGATSRSVERIVSITI